LEMLYICTQSKGCSGFRPGYLISWQANIPLVGYG